MFDTGSSSITEHGAYSIAIVDREIGEPSVELAAAICTEREIRARETVKDDIAKENGSAETEVTGAGWNGQPKFSVPR